MKFDTSVRVISYCLLIEPCEMFKSHDEYHCANHHCSGVDDDHVSFMN